MLCKTVFRDTLAIMHWSKKIAEDLIAKHPKLKEFVVASGISPSGSIHIGNFREFITNYYVGKALQTMGKKVRMIFSWDNFDRLRKVPKNVAESLRGGQSPTKQSSFEINIGKALSAIPNPFGEGSYAKHFQGEFEIALKELQMNEIPIDTKSQSDEYQSGRYADAIIHALKSRKKIYDILMSFKTQDGDEGSRETYYPIQIYCPTCGKDSTKITSCSPDCETVEYICTGDNTTHTTKIRSAKNIKLAWKIDWPMRWKAEGVHFESAGIDHHSDGGSFDVCSRICREIFDHEPPMSVCYAWVGIKGISSGNMASSTGVNITPETCLAIYEPEIIRWLYAKYDFGATFDFGFDDTITRHYMEFDRGVAKFLGKEDMEDYDRTAFELCLFKNTKSANQVSFGTLATVAPLANFDHALIEKMLGTKVDIERTKKVKFWLENYAPEKIYKLRDTFNAEFFAGLADTEKETLAKLKNFLQQSRTEKDIQEFLYQIINNPAASKKENITAQQRYFKIFYNMLFGRDDGPRLYLYLAVANRSEYLQRLYPR